MIKSLIAASFVGALFFSARPVFAVNDPPLFSCQSPVGSVIANSSGTHGVPGDSRTYTGSDTVYSIDESHVLQCLCVDTSTEGIQSNWWKISGMNQADIDFFVRRGWVYIPSGQPWGLSAAPYLVKNDAFVCGGVGGAGSGRSGQVLGTSSLAATGTTNSILSFFTLALVFGYLAYRSARE